VRAEKYCDLRTLLSLPRNIDLLWISTCCAQFTVQKQPFAVCVRNRKPIDLSVEVAARRLIDESRPRFWLLENVSSSREWLTPIFGSVRGIVAGHVIWGNLPLLIPWVKPYKDKTRLTISDRRKRHLQLSLIPYAVSAAIADTVERLSN